MRLYRRPGRRSRHRDSRRSSARLDWRAAGFEPGIQPLGAEPDGLAAADARVSQPPAVDFAPKRGDMDAYARGTLLQSEPRSIDVCWNVHTRIVIALPYA